MFKKNTFFFFFLRQFNFTQNLKIILHFIILKLLIKIGLTVRPLIYSEKVCVWDKRQEMKREITQEK